MVFEKKGVQSFPVNSSQFGLRSTNNEERDIKELRYLYEGEEGDDQKIIRHCWFYRRKFKPRTKPTGNDDVMEIEENIEDAFIFEEFEEERENNDNEISIFSISPNLNSFLGNERIFEPQDQLEVPFHDLQGEMEEQAIPSQIENPAFLIILWKKEF